MLLCHKIFFFQLDPAIVLFDTGEKAFRELYSETTPIDFQGCGVVVTFVSHSSADGVGSLGLNQFGDEVSILCVSTEKNSCIEELSPFVKLWIAGELPNIRVRSPGLVFSVMGMSTPVLAIAFSFTASSSVFVIASLVGIVRLLGVVASMAPLVLG